MALFAGARLGPYKIVSPLGAGGMREVYRARGLKLDRDVAIKILPGYSNGYDAAPDGSRFLMIKLPTAQLSGADRVEIILNWFEQLKATQ